MAGWERPNWFAPEGERPEYIYSFGKQNWFEYSAAEHRAARETCALFDQSSFSKYLVQGRDACRALQRLCSADIDVEPGRIVYTHWLNVQAGIEADLTVTRLDERRYWVVSGAAVTRRDLDWLARHIGDDDHCTVTDITSAWAVLGVMGPNSRALLTQVSDLDLSNDAFPFGHAKDIEIGCVLGRAHRVSYVGELGWEVYVPVDQARHVFEVITAAGTEHGLRLAGMHALDSLSYRTGFRALRPRCRQRRHPAGSGAGLRLPLRQAIPFVGRDAALRQKQTERPLKKRLVQFLLQDPEVMLYHHEPNLRDGELVGHLTSGNYGHTLGGSVGLGYVKHAGGVSRDYLAAGGVRDRCRRRAGAGDGQFKTAV